MNYNTSEFLVMIFQRSVVLQDCRLACTFVLTDLHEDETFFWTTIEHVTTLISLTVVIFKLFIVFVEKYDLMMHIGILMQFNKTVFNNNLDISFKCFYLYHYLLYKMPLLFFDHKNNTLYNNCNAY